MKPDRLLVPTAKDLAGPPPPPNFVHDHFKCYPYSAARILRSIDSRSLSIRQRALGGTTGLVGYSPLALDAKRRLLAAG